MMKFGSLLAICLILHILTGLFLATHYHVSCINNCLLVHSPYLPGWRLRMNYPLLNGNGASIFFVCLFTHQFLTLALTWSNAAEEDSQWIKPPFPLSFTFHFILPFIDYCSFSSSSPITPHETGSNNPTRISSDMNKIPFHPHYTIKDIWYALFLFLISLMLGTQTIILLLTPSTQPPTLSQNDTPYLQTQLYDPFTTNREHTVLNLLNPIFINCPNTSYNKTTMYNIPTP
ncbi:hypothetical protein E2I00_002203 [Balaenoptera physalus]|uniref:Cytochrome b/b6 N-terminal region profile domain-containing protein n=1 Tax=Balaenoptera physalus TaxID=9770 RepID=A0A6A1Q2Z7_BALPH|nr:hypothetical protein E2I00_002203 [Balaenoptera physalus]